MARLVRSERLTFGLKWLRAGQGDAVQLINVDDVVYFRSEQKYTSVFTADAEHLIRTSIKDLET